MKKEEIEEFIKDTENYFGCSFPHETTRLKVYSNPTIVHTMEDAFILNPAVEPEEIQMSCYIDRVHIRQDISKVHLKEILDSILRNFQSSEFVKNTDIVDKVFKIPGYNSYLREVEGKSQYYEIRFCAQGFAK